MTNLISSEPTINKCLFELFVKSLTEETKKEKDDEIWTTWIETYSKRLEKEVVHGEDLDTQNENRAKRMNEANPRFKTMFNFHNANFSGTVNSYVNIFILKSEVLKFSVYPPPLLSENRVFFSVKLDRSTV